jgi:hypothetical protein
MRIQLFVLSSSSAVIQSHLNLDPYGAFSGLGSASTVADQNAGAFNGEWDTGANDGLQNIGAFNGNFNGNAALLGNGIVTSYSVFGDGPVDVASGKEPGQAVHGHDGTGGMTFNSVIGDVNSLLGDAVGGNDRLYGGDNAVAGVVLNDLIGDANTMAGHARGGNDTLIGGHDTGPGGVENILVGDAVQLAGNAVGGQDKLVGGSNFGSGFVQNAECGDAITMERLRQGRA